MRAAATMRYLIAERERMRVNREVLKMPPPWTEDEVLANNRFCNVSRTLDRMSRELAADMRRDPTARRRALRAVAYRAFNRRSAWALLRPALSGATFDAASARVALSRAAAGGEKLLSGVWMTAGRPGEPAWRSQLGAVVDASRRLPRSFVTLAEAYAFFTSLPMVGPFVANEIVMDLTYLTDDLREAGDRLTFLRVGPGAVRGLRRLRGEEPGPGIAQPRPTEDDMRMFERTVADLQGRPPVRGLALTIHDVEHCLCEYDKYARGLEGGHLKNRYRPKP